MEWTRTKWQAISGLASDYVSDFDQVSTFFTHDPGSDEAWKNRAERLTHHRAAAADRSALADVLYTYNQEIGNAESALEAAKALAHNDTLVVVGGQQAGLFTGPMLSPWKALTIIQAARRAEKLLSRRVVPVFWIAGEDHDWDEVNHTYSLSPQGDVKRIRLEKTERGHDSVSFIELLPEDWSAALQELDESLLDTEFKPALMELIRGAVQDGGNLPSHFARLMAQLFGRHGLVLVNSADPRIRKLETPMFEQLIKNQKGLNQANLLGKRELEERGYEAQADVWEGQANLFVRHNGDRILLHRTDEGLFADRKGQLQLNQDDLLRLAKEDPARLSNNVLTRPLMQDFLFPVLATVLGPSEIAYWALLKPAFETLSMQMPIIVPRLMFTLMEGTIRKNMDKYELSFDDAVERIDDKQAAWLAAQDTLGLDERFSRIKTSVSDQYGPLLDMIASLQPALRKLGETNLSKITEQIDFLEAKTKEALKSRHEAGIRQFDRIKKTLTPIDKPQERVYNIFGYLAKYGSSWLDELVQSELPLDGRHYVVHL